MILDMELLNNLKNNFKNERKMLNFQRLAGSKKIRSYNLAEHSYFVGLLFQEVCDFLGVEFTTDVFGKVLRHDFMEVFTADLPYPVKNFNEKTKDAWKVIENELYKDSETITENPYLIDDQTISKDLSLGEFHILRWCDIVELLYFCLEEYDMGNSSLEGVIQKCVEIAESISIDYPPLKQLTKKYVLEEVNE